MSSEIAHCVMVWHTPSKARERTMPKSKLWTVFLTLVMAVALISCGDSAPKTGVSLNNGTSGNNGNNGSNNGPNNGSNNGNNGSNNGSNQNNVNNSNNSNNGSNNGSNNVAPEWQVCAKPSECLIRPNSCCAGCDEPNAAGVDAVNASMQDAHYAEVCPVAEICPRCAERPNPSLVATCVNSRCEVLDVENSSFGSCQKPDDCIIRSNRCCECGGGEVSDVIALNVSRVAEYEQEVCDADQGCPECVPSYDQFEADCVDNQCVVYFLE